MCGHICGVSAYCYLHASISGSVGAKVPCRLVFNPLLTSAAASQTSPSCSSQRLLAQLCPHSIFSTCLAPTSHPAPPGETLPLPSERLAGPAVSLHCLIRSSLFPLCSSTIHCVLSCKTVVANIFYVFTFYKVIPILNSLHLLSVLNSIMDAWSPKN